LRSEQRSSAQSAAKFFTSVASLQTAQAFMRMDALFCP
jgi:hypothetical protein